MKYIDVEKLKELIDEKWKELADKNVKVGGGKWDAEISTYLSVLRLIDSLQQEQISLPDNLDEAAEKYEDWVETYSQSDFPTCVSFKQAFKAGAEWMAGNGYTKEGIARPDDCEIWVNFTDTDIKDGDEVIVQIRKK